MESLQEEVSRLRKENETLKKNEKLFQALVASAVGNIGQDFFDNIVSSLSEWLNAECIIIGQTDKNNRVEALPMYMDGEIIHGYSYDLKGTPCELTSRKGFCFYPNGIISEFPEDKDLVDIKAEAYIGTALYNKDAKHSGVLCAISREQMQLPPEAEKIMKIVGERITAELERKKTQLELETSEASLRAANAAKDKLFSIISHDLISPFSNIMTISQILLDDIKTDDMDELEKKVQIIFDSSKQTYDLLKNLLDWSLTQIKGIEYSPLPLNLFETCNNVIHSISNLADHKDISLISTVPNNITLTADRNMLCTVIRNLIGNAIKYTGKSGKISISAKKTDKEITIYVSDTGVGIKPEAIENLFDFENQYTTLGTNKEKGTGLGLTLCKEFVEKHGGEIRVKSEMGKGTLFSFSIPILSQV